MKLEDENSLEQMLEFSYWDFSSSKNRESTKNYTERDRYKQALKGLIKSLISRGILKEN